jgi:nitrite reductase/ring-hydroxylating ferredoxin subunit
VRSTDSRRESDRHLAKHIVATVDEIPPGERKIVEVAGRSIGVFNLGGEYFALRNLCPHAGGPLCEGVLSGFVQARVPGEYSYVRRGEILRCPWHAWEFDVKTGQSWFDPAKTRVRTYDVTVEPGGDESTSSNELPEAGLERGPFTAETYSVSVNKQNVVLEL